LDITFFRLSNSYALDLSTRSVYVDTIRPWGGADSRYGHAISFSVQLCHFPKEVFPIKLCSQKIRKIFVLIGVVHTAALQNNYFPNYTGK
jgi:hypothetical protein